MIPKNILVISPTPSHPPTAGNRARINNLLCFLQTRGHRIHFAYEKREADFNRQQMEQTWQGGYTEIGFNHPQPFIARVFQRLARLAGLYRGKTFKIDDWYNPGLDNEIQTLQKMQPFDVVLVEYVFLSRVLHLFDTPTLKLLDTHDIFSDRHTNYVQNKLAPTWFSTSQTEEALGLLRADVIIAASAEDKRFFEGIQNKPVITVGHLVSLYPPGAQPAAPGYVLFVGSANPINGQAINHFITHTWPILQRKRPTTHLVIAGGVSKLVQSTGTNIRTLGLVSNLEQLYQSAGVVINPVLFGTGLGIKSIEALGYARPLVATSAGARGLEAGKDQAFFVADEPREFAARVITLLDDEQLYSAVCQNAYKFAQAWNEMNMLELEKLLEV